MTRLCRRSLLLASAILWGLSLGAEPQQGSRGQSTPNATAYLGFDANDYPGDAVLPRLRESFAFSGYWLNNPPAVGHSGTDADTWIGHRAALQKQGFGFLVLFDGRWNRELKSVANARVLGANDAATAVANAKREDFPPGTVIFVDQEEGGSMYDEQMAYLLAWFDGVTSAGFRAGIYCSGMPGTKGDPDTVTANYVREHAGARKIVYFVFDDACPPSPGCVYGANPPQPAGSGVGFAAVWQFAQSPRRRKFTRSCASTYNRDGNCYAPGTSPSPRLPWIDIESATSANPSGGR